MKNKIHFISCFLDHINRNVISTQQEEIEAVIVFHKLLKTNENSKDKNTTTAPLMEDLIILLFRKIN